MIESALSMSYSALSGSDMTTSKHNLFYPTGDSIDKKDATIRYLGVRWRPEVSNANEP